MGHWTSHRESRQQQRNVLPATCGRVHAGYNSPFTVGDQPDPAWGTHGDGYTDLAIANYASYSVTVLWETGRACSLWALTARS